MIGHSYILSNRWGQATPDCAFLFFLIRRPGTPDPDC